MEANTEPIVYMERVLHEEDLVAQKGLLTLPPEIRQQIYELVVVKSRNTITMLSNAHCFQSEVGATQPALSFVNHQLRREALDVFYANNLFLAEISLREDLESARRWLYAIGEQNVACLRRLALCGWTRLPFGHMTRRQWVRVVLDLKEADIKFDEGESYAEQHPQLIRMVDELKSSFQGLVRSRKGESFDAGSLWWFMEAFHLSCVAY
ncbi:hypothetical protein BAUCODRAFT_30644 [Baudoinia panamericana UAMH 10762]|uniref:F-box domain-containing protein n=1 Tax=Baudoinia panamericana (strain UAMH 10762) TaxID=717646 RepID=M2N7U5_BAUPA|nr:uncharacterized protein BAUCODRAFT_30644 [Baudoinia panamericana UAMH 10762]EMD00174.1 hypothetical protein BAUCODRAFT_30644 [Baudoinia panamericana UAMH 10762]